MEKTIQVYEFEGQLVEFDLLPNANIMVNATEMAKKFGKDVPDFMILKQTKDFIAECLNNQNSGYLNIQNEEDLVISKQKSGTWMHRILALKFAAWLNPSFELWVYKTIDDILFGHLKNIEQELFNLAEIDKGISVHRQNLNENNDYIEMQRLEFEKRQAKYRIARTNRNQVEIFKTNLNQ